MHEEMTIIYNKEMDWKSNIKKHIRSFNTIGQTIKPTSSPSTLKIDKSIDNPISKQTYNNNLKDLYKDDYINIDINENKNDQLAFKIIRKISPYIDTLDYLLLKISR